MTDPCVQAVNGAGLEAVDTSKPVVVLTTTPSPGAVFDGPVPATVATTADLDFVTSPSEVEAFWSGFSTPLNPVASYTVSLGTCPGCVDVIADFDIGLSQGMWKVTAGRAESVSRSSQKVRKLDL